MTKEYKKAVYIRLAEEYGLQEAMFFDADDAFGVIKEFMDRNPKDFVYVFKATDTKNPCHGWNPQPPSDIRGLNFSQVKVSVLFAKKHKQFFPFLEETMSSSINNGVIEISTDQVCRRLYMIKNPKINGVPLDKWLESLSPEGVDSVTLPIDEIPGALLLLGQMWREHKQLRRFIQEDLGYTLRGWRQSEGKPKKPKEEHRVDEYGFHLDAEGNLL